MKKIYEELLHDAFCECMQNNHGKDWIDRYTPEEQENMRREFYSGAEWQAMQALSQEQIDTTLSDYINSTKKLKINSNLDYLALLVYQVWR
ncbi:hypothetical protein [Bacteroides sp.]|uniref:hypothetical protein n=1 Tax=Bacteroides sp. TaxID=29523 RepID=UPI0025B9408A|nr:hypothetical protein [Bacteroides sp.]